MTQLIKNPPANAGDKGLIPKSGRNPEGEHSNTFQCSYLENPWTEEPGELVNEVAEWDMTQGLSKPQSSNYLQSQRQCKWLCN